MKTILWICLGLLAVQVLSSATYITPLKFTLDDCEYEVSREWTKVTIAVNGGIQPYDFYFDEYPQNWKYIRQDMYVPRQSLKKNQRYPCKTRVFDSNRNQARATIVFEVFEGKVSLLSTLYAYDKIFDDSFYNWGKFRGKPVLIKSGSYYNQADNIEYTNSPYYTPVKDLNTLKQKVDQLVSGTISKSLGTGLDQILTESDYTNAYTDKNTFSLTKLLSGAQNPTATSVPIVVSTIPTIPGLGEAISIPTMGSTSFKVPTYNWNAQGGSNNNYGDLLNTLRSQTANNANNQYNIPQFGTKIIETPSKQPIDTTPSPVPTPIQPKSSDKVFLKLPSSSEVDNMILTVDLFGMTKLIQDINKTTAYSCDQKVSYVYDLLGRLQTAISMKSFAAEQLESLASTATTNYNNLIGQIKQKNDQINQLNLKALKTRLQTDLNTLEDLYMKYNSAANTSDLEVKIVHLNKNIAIQKAKSDVDRQELIRQKLSYSEADDYVKKIEAQIKDARTRKSTIEANISKSEGLIKECETKISLNQGNVTLLESDLKNLESNSDQLKTGYQNLETSVERFRADIARGSKKEDQYLTDITILEERLKLEKKKLATEELAKLKEMVAILSKTLPTIESFVDTNYYQCFEAKNLTTAQNESASVYILSLTNFLAYIESSYQIKPDWKKVNIVASEIRLTPINIMDSAWQAAFGLPYDIISYASANDFSFPNDFNCLSPSTLMSGQGVIAGISNRVITISNEQGGFQILNLGCCSRLETTQYLPSIGQRIYWRGNPGAKTGQFNIYRATCL